MSPTAIPTRPRGDEEPPSVVVFDVNETLLDVEALGPLFEGVFGDRRVLREWFGQLVLYSMTATLSGLYEDFFSLGRGVFEMLGAAQGVAVEAADVEALREGLLSMPAHPDVEEGLGVLKRAGFRLVTLTNSPPNPRGESPLEHAGLAGHFERQFSVHAARAFKPTPHVYRMVADELGVTPPGCCMVACHAWDTIGARAVGFSAGLITRPGNAPLPAPGLPWPDVVAPDLPALAARMIERWRS
ncbi:(S)-2-haloacid dehalogenase 4A [Aquisphaera giovannonii]|uniref:(S)-2-haloacid dehalogenase 4A n=1 Tax=Aquisphaera giovannonii TaxID=406548 RepID=A0A5B9W5N0_9BACT|nr:haloacid dehalogenase type II [Aquisphaera giovannonii]QEH35504.1 (S)-2-haloacid dehalogenase 4A [Aquisphaera giovannonii]